MFYQKLHCFFTNFLLMLIALPLTPIAGVLAWQLPDYDMPTTIMIATAMAVILRIKSIE